MYFRICIVLSFLLLPVLAKSQAVSLISVDQLNSRFAHGGDTVYVVNFWATWCKPCVAELPNFDRLQTAYKNQPLKVLLVNLDFKSRLKSQVEPFVRKQKPVAPVYQLSDTNQQEYIDRISKDWSGALPATMLVGKKGADRKFVEKELSFAELENIYQSFKE